MLKTKPISVVGLGSIHNLSNNSTAFADTENKKLAEIFPKIPLRRIPRYARMGLLAGAKALENIEHSSNIGLVVGSAYAGIHMSMDFMDSILDAEPRLSSPTAFSHAVNNMGAGLLSLYLNLQGPCHTVTQFSLSLVGALHMASTLIYANRAEYVLVGCMDEKEERFSKCCLVEDNNLAEGAIFFLVSAENENLSKISVSWNNNQHLQANHNISPLAGETSLHYALKLQQTLESNKTQDILCKSINIPTTATIHVWS